MVALLGQDTKGEIFGNNSCMILTIIKIKRAKALKEHTFCTKQIT